MSCTLNSPPVNLDNFMIGQAMKWARAMCRTAVNVIYSSTPLSYKQSYGQALDSIESIHCMLSSGKWGKQESRVFCKALHDFSASLISQLCDKRTASPDSHNHYDDVPLTAFVQKHKNDRLIDNDIVVVLENGWTSFSDDLIELYFDGGNSSIRPDESRLQSSMAQFLAASARLGKCLHDVVGEMRPLETGS